MRVIVVGSGKIVYFLARQFVGRRYRVTVITADDGEARFLSRRLKATVLHGDGSDPRLLEAAGARRAEAVLALTAKDQDNLAVCQIARRLFKVPRTIGLVNDPQNEEIFRKLGVTIPFSATQILAGIIEERAGFEEISSLIPVAEGKVTVSEVALRHDAPVLGRTLQELEFPDGALLGGIIREGMVIIPKGNTPLLEGDRLILVSQPGCYERVLELLSGEENP
ncbi:MAG: NAD-binding protein [Deltaproteobacteria bacterium]|nr:NAD-binding protein [Deltaproteobacteria bacterium]